MDVLSELNLNWSTVIVALIAASPGIYAVISKWRKDSADADLSIAEAAEKLVRIQDAKMEDCLKKIKEHEARIRRLEKQIRSLGETPTA